MATIQNIYRQVEMINPRVSTVSSLGEFVDANNQQLADYMIKEIMGYLPKDSLAWKILTGTSGRYTEKQMWVIAYELQKNADYVAKLDETLAEIEEREAWKRAARRAKRQAKAARQTEIAKAPRFVTNNEPIAPKAQDTNVTFKVGDTVDHTKFGEGTVIAGDEKTITVRFATVGEKQLLLEFAPITKK